MLRLVNLFLVISLLLLSQVHATSESEATPPVSTQEANIPKNALDEVEKSTPSPLPTKETPPSSLDLIGRIFIYLALLAAIGGVILHFFKQGKFVKGIRANGKLLKVSETHMLGNKQFLVVVEYGKQKVLLGVGPGMINKLCFLDSSENPPSEKDNLECEY